MEPTPENQIRTKRNNQRNVRLNGDASKNHPIQNNTITTTTEPSSDVIYVQPSPSNLKAKLNVIWDMETGDPDDFLTLIMLCCHPSVSLRAVTIVPGSKEQVGVVKAGLQQYHPDYASIPVGSRNPSHPKKCVSNFHYEFSREQGWSFTETEPDGLGCDIIYSTLQKYPDCTIITGGPLGNLGTFLKKYENVAIERWVAQGGFAGDNIVPSKHRLTKFNGKTVCDTYNFGGDVLSATAALNSKMIKSRLLVSKNVCHGVVYDDVFHNKVTDLRKDSGATKNGIDTLCEFMMARVKRTGRPKALHDPLAACVAIDPSICEFAQVEMYNVKPGGWGAKPSQSPSTFISVAANKTKFAEIFALSH